MTAGREYSAVELGMNSVANSYEIDQQPVFLMAEDNPLDTELVKAMLEQAFGQSYTIVCVTSFSEMKAALEAGEFEALILDMNLPDTQDTEKVQHLGELYPELPVVILTGQDNLTLAIESLKRGAQDYLCKNHVTSETLARSLRYAQERKQIELQLRSALDESQARSQQLEESAHHDHLTRLPNRAFFESSAQTTLQRAARLSKKVALVYLDLNDFKHVNDSFGHDVGDALLIQTAERLNQVVRESDMVARLGGDEFVLLTDLLSDEKDIYALVNRVQDAFKQPFQLDYREVHSTPSIGVAFYPEAQSLEGLLKHADYAMYQAKQMRHGHVCFYTEQMDAAYVKNQQIEAQVQSALINHEFSVHYQPIISLSAEKHLSYEALLRWHSPLLGPIPPDDFIAVVENSAVIDQLTDFVLMHVSQLIQQLRQDGQLLNNVKVNITAGQLSSSRFIQHLLSLLHQQSIPGALLCLELTERQMVHDLSISHEHIQLLRTAGVRIALDDFGTGYSSMTHLIELPIDYLKLDQSLTAGIEQHPRNQAVVAGIVEMAHRIQVAVIAEGVERKEELDCLRQLGCDYAQGFYIATPQPLSELATLHSLSLRA